MLPLLWTLTLLAYTSSGQVLGGPNIGWLKYDYCYKGSNGCNLSNCGSVVGECIADAYILSNTCTASGLGLNQPPADPNVVSSYGCDKTNGQSRTNYTSLSNCQSSTSPIGTVPFSSIGYSNFCYGGAVSWNDSTFGQFSLSSGYQLLVTYACPGDVVTAMTFIQDPPPSACVSNVVSCASANGANFVVSTVCYPNGPTQPTTSTTGSSTTGSASSTSSTTGSTPPPSSTSSTTGTTPPPSSTTSATNPPSPPPSSTTGSATSTGGPSPTTPPTNTTGQSPSPVADPPSSSSKGWIAAAVIVPIFVILVVAGLVYKFVILPAGAESV